jgi:hypothetical protein
MNNPPYTKFSDMVSENPSYHIQLENQVSGAEGLDNPAANHEAYPPA